MSHGEWVFRGIHGFWWLWIIFAVVFLVSLIPWLVRWPQRRSVPEILERGHAEGGERREAAAHRRRVLSGTR